MPERFVFRQVDYRDISTFLNDGEVRAPNHPQMQHCFQTSYTNLTNRRGTNMFPMPCGGVVNDYVAFYFSPFTRFTYAIHMGNKVSVIDPSGNNLGLSNLEDRVFLVGRVVDLCTVAYRYCFSDFPLNCHAPVPTVITDTTLLSSHINWDVFDEDQTGHIPEIGYQGACRYSHTRENIPKYQFRGPQRMAEFLVHNSLSLNQISCIIVPNDAKRDLIQKQMDSSIWDIPVYTKRGCFV